jgi:NAD(P)-dependent dehydrogenase (short-subunit alcohol dehydrogenase family)
MENLMKHKNDLVGKTIVITGATSGIGRAALHALTARGAYVIGVGRSPARCQETQRAILAGQPNARVDFAMADLSSQRQVRSLAETIRQLVQTSGGGKIDALVNNAATVSSWYAATEDGYELQFAVNHLAPFLLTHELMPLLEKAPSARIVTVSSSSHYSASIHWKDVMYRQRYSILQAYKQSKLANVLFSVELNRRLGKASHVRAYAADPGLVSTQIGLKGTSGIANWVWHKRMERGVSPEKGAETVVFLATDPHVEGSNEVYWKDCQPKAPSRYARRTKEADRLWVLSERLCGVA